MIGEEFRRKKSKKITEKKELIEIGISLKNKKISTIHSNVQKITKQICN